METTALKAIVIPHIEFFSSGRGYCIEIIEGNKIMPLRFETTNNPDSIKCIVCHSLLGYLQNEERILESREIECK